MNTKVGYKEKSFIVLILTFVFILILSNIPKGETKTSITKKEPEIKIEEKITKPKKEIQKKESTISITNKKKIFLKNIVPIVTKVYDELYRNFLEIKLLIEQDPNNSELEKLKEKYRVNTNIDLLIILKPHPISITLSQAAIESAWGTSRFFNEANNIFGVWSFNENEPRIEASEKRGDKTIYLKKFLTLENAIKQYYNMLSTKKIYYKFKVANYYYNDPIKIAKKLLKYSELGEEYTKKITAVLNYNKFKKYDKTVEKI